MLSVLFAGRGDEPACLVLSVLSVLFCFLFLCEFSFVSFVCSMYCDPMGGYDSDSTL